MTLQVPLQPRRPGASAAAKVALIALLGLVLLIPLFLVWDIIGEREARHDEVVARIGEGWGGPQRVSGPILVIPYRIRMMDEEAEGGARLVQRWAYVLPDTYRVRAVVSPETRRIGIFEAVVYTVNLSIDGVFVMPDPTDLTGVGAAVNWTEAFIYVGVADPRSIREGVSLYWDGREDIPFTPGGPGALGATIGGGMTARISGLAEVQAGQTLAFATDLSLNGSGALSFLPLGRENAVAVSAAWPHPSFEGAFLPIRSEVGADGFTAEWELSYFGRGYPQSWSGGDGYDAYLATMPTSAFGVSFYQPVDGYQQTERAAKYGVLFVAFTFVVLFLFETVGRMRIHVVQYALVGLSLCLFYLLLLSFAEQMGFAGAYALGAAAVVVQLVLYCRPVLGRWSRALGLGLLLAALYAALYVLLQLEDLALLIGSVGLFLALSAVMYATRRIDWYATGPAETEPAAGADAPASRADPPPPAGLSPAADDTTMPQSARNPAPPA